MDIARELHELASIEAEDRKPVVSLYLNSRWANEQQRRKVRLFVRARCHEARRLHDPAGAVGAALDRDLDRIEARVERLVVEATDAAGVALFASEPHGLWKELFSRLPFEPHFAVAATPQLLPLAALSGVYRPLLVAIVDHAGAELFETALGDLTLDLELAKPAADKLREHGWFHRHYRRKATQTDPHLALEIVEILVPLFDRDPRTSVVLSGPEDEVARLRALLPRRVQERLLSNLRLNRQGSHSDAIGQLTEELIAQLRRGEPAATERVIGEAMAGGLAVLGPEDVSLAALEGRIHKLFLERDFAQPGWQCPHCDALGLAAQAACPYCGGPTAPAELGESVTRRVLRGGGGVEVIDDDARLRHFDGMAAQLRHRGTKSSIGFVYHGAF